MRGQRRDSFSNCYDNYAIRVHTIRGAGVLLYELNMN